MTEMEERIAKYESELVRLRTENDQLRRSAQAFGELAERLNRALLIATAARHTQGALATGCAPDVRRLGKTRAASPEIRILPGPPLGGGEGSARI
jgi:hypothetical protein